MVYCGSLQCSCSTLCECCRSTQHQHTEVWPWSRVHAAPHPSLVGCQWSDKIPFTCVTVYKCVHGMAPGYLSQLCRPVSELHGRHHLHSAGRDFPHVRRATYGKRSFAYAGPSAWNSLPDDLRNNSLRLSVFLSKLRSHLFVDTSTSSALEVSEW